MVDWKNEFLHTAKKSFKNKCHEYKKQIYSDYKSLNTISTKLSLMNTFIKTNLPKEFYDISKIILKLDDDDKQSQMKTQKDGYIAKLKDRIPIDVKLYLAMIEKYKSSDDYIELIACINMATGRRLIEIIKCGSFKKSDSHNVIFSGQAKKREKDVPYKIPVILLTPDELLKVFKKLRSQKLRGTDSISRSLNVLYANKLGKNITSEVVRGAYANICYKMYSDESYSKALYGNEVLGHKKNDLNTFSVNYDRVYLTNHKNIF